MGRRPFLTFAVTHEGTLGDVIVETIYIRIGMMDDIMFEFPDKGIASQRIKRKPHQPVDPFPAGIAAVTGIVHDIKTDAGQY